jgi:hypothetical protein
MQEHFSKLLLTLLLLLAVAGFTVSVAPSLPLGFTIGSDNVVIADPALPRPFKKPCSVVLFSDQVFNSYKVHNFQYTPPAACHAPWAKVVLEVNLSINPGVQYDRTAHIFLGGANIYTGTTEEPDTTITRHWHVERDVTDYSALFTRAQQGTVDLGNTVNPTDNSVLNGTATLQLYPAENNVKPETTPDEVYPMMSATLNTYQDQLTSTIHFPSNVVRAFVDVLAQGQIGDEFWYFCVPTALSAELFSCNNTAFRETEIFIDGRPAGVAPVYPWIFTGGLDPLLWRPTPGVQALSLMPYRVDISPFAGLLSNGKPHTISIRVLNANSYFLATGVVLVYLDHRTKQVTGGIISNTLRKAVQPTIINKLTIDGSGNVLGTLTISSKREFKISGYLTTSHGRVDTLVSQTMSFQNVQIFTKVSQNTIQITDVVSESQVCSDDAGEIHERRHTQFPLSLLETNFGFVITQAYHGHNTLKWNNNVMYDSQVFNKVTPTDNPQQKSVQHFDFIDSIGSCYNRVVTSKAGVLTALVDGASCPGHRNQLLHSFVDPYGIKFPDTQHLNIPDVRN